MNDHCIPKKLRFGAVFGAGAVIGPYCFRDDQDRHVTVNGNRYRSMITEYFWPQLYDMDLVDIWRHKPHSECHNQFIGKLVWRTCYLTKWSSRLDLDFFLSGYVKSMVYANKPATIGELRTNIEREIAAVSANLNCQKLGSASGLLQACPWSPCKRNRVSFIMASKLLLQE